MRRFSVSVVIAAAFFVISTHTFNVDKFLKEYFGEEDVDETEPTAYLRQQGLILDEVEPYGLGDTLNIPASEMSALHDLYNALNGDDWAWVNNSYVGIPWNFSATANPCTDHWQGISCTTEITNMTEHLYVEGIKLSAIHLRGTIPETIGNFTQLRILNFLTNAISGSIPEAVYTLSELIFLDFGYNFMNGTISNDIAKCPALTELMLNNNNFTGPLPERLSEITGLKQLTLNNNEFIGTLPSSYGNLVQLTILNIGFNFLVGTIPSSLGQLTQLTQLAVNKNYFDGTLPDSFANLVALNVIYLDYNGFYGPVPEYFSTYSALIYLIMDENYFSGTIPASLAQLTSCTHLYIHRNAFTGTIPPELGNMTQLTLIDFHGNKLTGTIPPELGVLTNLGVLNLYTNFLTGTLPAKLGGLSLIQNIDLSSNYLTGTIPLSLGNLTTCLSMKMHETQLSGPIPSTFGNLASGLYLSFHSNHHTGTIPSSIARLPYLNSFFMYSNMFTGNIAHFINPSVQHELAIVQLSNNRFTGQIPDSLFALPKLQTVALVSNCFSGTIPPAICKSTTLKSLSLDGLRSASSCPKQIFPGLFDSYVLQGNIKSGIPSCLFEMPSLNTLHLSGNGITGTLPQNISLGSELFDLSLSHNSLKGDIPVAFQQRVFFNLDLSYNKFGGTLTESFATVIGNVTVMEMVGLQVVNASTMEYTMPTAALSLRNNRLSNVIPQSVVQMKNVSILNGNLFSCSVYQTDLPSNDSGEDTYECGSNSLNISGYIYAGAIGFIIVVLLLAWSSSKKARQMLHTSVQYVRSLLTVHSDHFAAHVEQYTRYCLLTTSLLRTASYCVLFIICIMLPVYCVLSKYYGTHLHEYAWTASGAYLSGITAFVVTIVMMVSVQCIFLYFVNLANVSKMEEKSKEVALALKVRVEQALVCCFFVCTNVAIVSVVNFAYVYIVIYGMNAYLTVTQIAMSIFKLMWSNIGSVYVLRVCKQLLLTSTGISKDDERSYSDDLFVLQLFVTLFNTIVVPIVVVGLVNPNCFSGVLVAAPPVTAFYYYEECTLFTVLYGCQAYYPQIAETTYTPPFTYSYQCSSNLVSYYAPTFVYMGFVAVFANPLLNLFQRIVYVRCKQGPFRDYVLRVVPLILQDVAVQMDIDVSRDIATRVYFKANSELVALCNFLCITLTYGVLFPPLALSMLIAMFSVMYISRIKVGRLLSAALKTNQPCYADFVNLDCVGVGTPDKLNPCVKQLVLVSVLFYSFFLFDILGDDISAEKTLWIFLVVPVVFLLLLLFYYFCGIDGASESREDGVFGKSQMCAAIEADVVEPPNADVEMQSLSVRSSVLVSDSSTVVSALHSEL